MLRCAIALASIATLALAIAYAARDRWTGSALTWAARRFAGASLEIDGAHWSGLHRVELLGVRFVSGPGMVPCDARIESLALDIDAADLARGRITGVRSIEFDRATATIDASAAAPPPSPTSPNAVAPFELLSKLPREAPAIHVHALDLDLALSSARSVALRGASLEVEPKAGETAITASAARVEYRDAERTLVRPFELQATWSANELDVTHLEIDPRYRLTHFHANWSRVAAGEVDVDLAGGAFAGEHELHAALARDRISLHLRSRAIDLANAATLLAPDSALDLAGSADIDADVAFPIDAPSDASGHVVLDLLGPKAFGRELDWAHADLSADARGWQAREIFLVLGENQGRISDLFLPRGALDTCAIPASISAAFDAELGDLSALLAEVGEAPVALHPHRASLRGRIAGGMIELDGGNLSVTGGHLTIDRGRVPFSTDWRALASDPALDLRLHARFEDVGALAELWPIPRMQGSLVGAVGIVGGEEGLHGWADVQAEDLRVADEWLGSVAGHCDLGGGRLDLQHMTVIGPDASLDLHGRYWFDARRFEGLSAKGWLRDASVLHIEALPRGGVEIDADVSGAWPRVDARVFARAAELETELLGTVRAEVTARSTQGLIDVDELAIDSRYGRILARGAAGALADLSAAKESKCLRLDALSWSDGGRRLALAEPVDVEIPPRGVSVNGLTLSGEGVHIEGDVAIDGPNGRVRSRVHADDPTPWIAPFLPEVRCARTDLEADAHWSPVDVAGKIQGRVENLRVGANSPPADVEISASLADKRAIIERLAVAAIEAPSSANAREAAPSDKDEPLVFSGNFPLDLRGPELLPDGAIRLDGAFEVRDLRRLVRSFDSNPRDIAGRLRAKLDLEGTWSAPLGSIHFEADELSFVPRPNEATFGPCSLRGAVRLDRDLTIDDLTLDLPAGVHIDGRGTLHGPFDLRRALNGDVSAWKELPIDLAARLEASDLARLTVMIPSLRRLGGKLEGDVKLAGTLAEPKFAGELALADGEVRAASSLPSLSGIKAKLVLDGERIRVDALNGEMGGAPFSLTGSISPFGADPSVDLSLAGEHLLLYRASGIRVRADARLTITGPVRAMQIGGALALDDSRFTHDFDFLSSFGKHTASPPLFSRPLFELGAPFDAAVLDVKLDSTNPFVIANNVLNGGLRANLRLVGTGALPILRGTIVIEPTRVSLPSGKITTRSGTLEFLPSAPFAPRIDVLADTRMQGYDIKIHLSGTIEEPIVDLSSVPPLSHEDLLLLVLTGTLPRTDQKSPTGTRAAKTVAVYFANDVVSNWFRGSGSGGGATDSDVLEVETGHDASETTGVESATARLRVWKGVFSKNSSLYVTGERDIYDRYNFGLRILFRFQ